VARIDLEQLLSAKHERVVHDDNIVTFKDLVLQTTHRASAQGFRASSGIVSSISEAALRVSDGHP